MNSLSSDLTQASIDGDLTTVKALIESGVSPNATNEFGVGPLLTFYPEVIDYLLRHGACPDEQQNEFGASVLAGLTYVDKVDCVRLLLEHGADPDLGRTKSGETPLHHAFAGAGYIDRTELIQLLVEHGADVNARTVPGVLSLNFWRDARTRGESALHRAAAYGSIDAIRILLAAGADRTLRDANGDSPLSWASWHRRPKAIIDLLDPEGPSG